MIKVYFCSLDKYDTKNYREYTQSNFLLNLQDILTPVI